MFKIISTLGPASVNSDFLTLCGENQQLHFRLNGSHLNAATLRQYVETVRKTLPREHIHFYLDLQGSKVRIGELPHPLELRKHDTIALQSQEDASGEAIPISQELFLQLRANLPLHLQDGTIRLQILRVTREVALAQVVQGGILRSRAGLYFPGLSPFQQDIPAAQKEQIQLAAELNIDHLALSYVQSAAEMQILRDYCQKLGYTPTLIAKIERPEALDALPAIAEQADELWYCRGDLGDLLPWHELGPWQEATIRIARELQKPVFIAGQVFHHMTHHPQPTRSEVVHLYYIQKQGVSGVVLSDETAIGRYPGETLRTILQLI